MHVQFFPVYVLTCGAHNSEPSLSFDLRIDSYESPDSSLTEFNLFEEPTHGPKTLRVTLF